MAIQFVTKTILDWVLVNLDSVEFLWDLFPLEVEVIHRIVLAVDAIKIILDGGRRGGLKFAGAAVLLRIVILLSLPVMTRVVEKGVRE